MPYILVAFLLVLSRLPKLPIGGILKTVNLQWQDVLGTGITASSQPFYLPGTILIISAIVTFFLHRMTTVELKAAVKDSGKILLGAGFVLIFTVPMVRIYINSGTNDLGLASMPVAMAAWVADAVGGVWPFFAPGIG